MADPQDYKRLHDAPAPGYGAAQGHQQPVIDQPQSHHQHQQPAPGPGQPYQGQPYQGQPYQGQLYQGQPYQGQPYQGQSYQGHPYQGHPYQGQPYQYPHPPPGPPGHPGAPMGHPGMPGAGMSAGPPGPPVGPRDRAEQGCCSGGYTTDGQSHKFWPDHERTRRLPDEDVISMGFRSISRILTQRRIEYGATNLIKGVFYETGGQCGGVNRFVSDYWSFSSLFLLIFKIAFFFVSLYAVTQGGKYGYPVEIARFVGAMCTLSWKCCGYTFKFNRWLNIVWNLFDYTYFMFVVVALVTKDYFWFLFVIGVVVNWMWFTNSLMTYYGNLHGEQYHARIYIVGDNGGFVMKAARQDTRTVYG